MRSLPDHLSHSSRETLIRCAHSWMLRYLTDAPQQPSLWGVVGSTVHEATEKYDTMALVGQEHVFNAGFTWERLFERNVAKAKEKEPNPHSWRQSPSEPMEVWATLGPQFIRSYVSWRERSPYEMWTTPDGSPAIELNISGSLPGCPVEVWAFLDRVFWDPVLKQLIIVDLKTSKRPPATADQFAVYAALLEVKYGVRADIGVAFMNRKGTLAKPWSLAEFTPEAVGAVFGEAWELIQAGNFPANPGRACYLCDCSSSCFAVNGPLATLHDPDHPSREAIPF